MTSDSPYRACVTHGGAGRPIPKHRNGAPVTRPRRFACRNERSRPDDYAEVAERHPEVQRAAATVRWTGSWYTVFLTVDRAVADRSTAFEQDLRGHLERFRMAGHDTRDRRTALCAAGARAARLRRFRTISAATSGRVDASFQRTHSAGWPARILSSRQIHFRPAGLPEPAFTRLRRRSPVCRRRASGFTASATRAIRRSTRRARVRTAGDRRGSTTIRTFPRAGVVRLTLAVGDERSLSTCACRVERLRLLRRHRVATPPRDRQPARPARAIAFRVGTHAHSNRACWRSSTRRRARCPRCAARRASTTTLLSRCSMPGRASLTSSTFYQSASPTKPYLGTATERRSLIDLARAIGYELRSWRRRERLSAFTLESAVGSPEAVTIDKGLRVQSIPGPGEKPQKL